MRPAPAVAALLITAALLLTGAPNGVAPPAHAQPVAPWMRSLWIAPGGLGRPVPNGTRINVTITLEPARASALWTLDRALSDPASPQFGRYLPQARFAREFDPSQANVSEVADYFAAHGAGSITVGPDRMSLGFPIRAGDVTAALSSPLVVRPGPAGGTERNLERLPRLPAEISPMILGISGLTGYVSLAPPRDAAAPLRAPVPTPGFLSGSGPAAGAQWFVGSDYASLYDETPEFPGNPRSMPNASYATNETVATLLESGYNATHQVDLPPWDPAAIEGYLNRTAGPGWPAADLLGVPVTLDNVTPPRPGPSGAWHDDSNFVVENALDLEMAASLAPGVEVANFYFAASLQYAPGSTGSADAIATDDAAALGQALNYDFAPRHLRAVSASFGTAGLNDTLWDVQLAHAAAIGVTVVASSGDAGNAPARLSAVDVGEGPAWPACAASEGWGVIAVGGTTLTSAGSPNGSYDGASAPALAYDGATGGLLRSAAWYDVDAGPGNYTGSQGGGAANYSEPSWQFDSAAQPAIEAAELLEGDTVLHRAGPDVAFAANDTLVAISANATGALAIAPLAGTSIAAPLFAGLLAEWAAVTGRSFGFLDPTLYRMGGYFLASPSAADPFLDVRTGGNYRFSAGPGWDAVTGWGGIDAALFLPAYENASIRGFVYTGPTPRLPAPATAGFSVSLLGAVLVLLAGTLLVIAGVLWARTDRRRIGLIVPRGPTPPPGGPQFDCPYCGRPRPAEAVRCPSCGRL